MARAARVVDERVGRLERCRARRCVHLPATSLTKLAVLYGCESTLRSRLLLDTATPCATRPEQSPPYEPLCEQLGQLPEQVPAVLDASRRSEPRAAAPPVREADRRRRARDRVVGRGRAVRLRRRSEAGCVVVDLRYVPELQPVLPFHAMLRKPFCAVALTSFTRRARRDDDDDRVRRARAVAKVQVRGRRHRLTRGQIGRCARRRVVGADERGVAVVAHVTDSARGTVRIDRGATRHQHRGDRESSEAHGMCLSKGRAGGRAMDFAQAGWNRENGDGKSSLMKTHVRTWCSRGIARDGARS